MTSQRHWAWALSCIFLASGLAADLLFGQGDLAFLARRDFVVAMSPRGVVAGDFNGDAILDLATANWNRENISILLGQGDGTFRPAGHLRAGSSSTALVAQDLNGDAFVDLAVTNYSPGTVSVLLGQGDGTFGEPQAFPVGRGPMAIVAGDLNGDQIADLAVANWGSPGPDTTISLLFGHGDGTFQPARSRGVGVRPSGVVIGDFNGDTTADLAVANNISNDVTTWRVIEKPKRA